MKIAVNDISRSALSAVSRAGGRVVYDASDSIVIVAFPETARIQSHGGTSDVQDAFIELDETGETVLRYHRAWSIEESCLVMADEEIGA
jgi:hypothetical protein